MTKAPHILIVDDHREIRELVSRALAKEGFRVSLAADGKAMRKVLADAQIDLILLDLMLPGESGLALCRDVRSTSNTPIIMVTAKGEEIDRVIGELQNIRSLLHSEGDRVRREITGYAGLSQSAVSTMKVIADTLSQLKPGMQIPPRLD